MRKVIKVVITKMKNACKRVKYLIKVEKIKGHSLNLIPYHLHLQWKFKLLSGKYAWGNKAKHWWVMSTNFSFSNVCWQQPAMFCLYTTSKHSHPYFDFSLTVKVMGLNPGYLLKSILLYFREKEMCKIRFQTPKNYFQIFDLEVLFWISLSHIWVKLFLN